MAPRTSDRPDEPLDAVFGALADPTRRAIVERLTQGEATVSELAEPFDLTFAAVSKHLGVLEDAGLIARRKEGRLRRCRLVEDPLGNAIEWMVHHGAFWEERLDALAELVEGSARERRR
jgi:DNA-binding transcriptional ArsR family regulator